MLVYLDTLIGFATVMLGLSLIITILNQVVSVFLAHRGANLRWGLEVLFEKISPGAGGLPMLKANAGVLAETVLLHPLISDSVFSTVPKAILALLPDRLVDRWRLANAIRPEELAGILSHIAQNQPDGMSPGLHAMLAAEINSLLNTPDPLAARQGALAASAAAALPPPLVSGAVTVTPTEPGHLEQWFGSIMDRVSQRFTLWMRIWTVIFAIVIGFGAGVDSIELVNKIYGSSDLRGKLVALAPKIEDTAKKIIPAGASTEQEVVQKNVAQLTADAVNQAIADAKLTGVPAAKPEDFVSLDALPKWLEKNIPDPANRKAFDAVFPAASAKLSIAQLQTAKQIRDDLAGAGLPLELRPLGKLFTQETLPHIPGMFITVLLLSLGAPFWFNSLSSLTNLRPLLSSKDKAEQEAKLPK